MDHASFVKSLGKYEREALTAKSDAAGLVHFALHLGLIFVFLCFVQSGWWGWPLAMVGAGIAMVFLFTLLHETTHFTPFKSTWLNQVVGGFCGLVLGIAPLWFRYFHLAHHRYTQDPARDPELATAKPATRAAYFRHLTGLSIWKNQALTLIKTASWGELGDFVPDRRARDVRLEARALLVIYTAIALFGFTFGWTWLFWLWIGPLLLGQPFLRAYLLAEHADCDHGADMFANTRTTFTTRIVRFLAWNMPFHAEHHAYPTVPFHALPRLHELSRAHLQVTQDGYATFNRDYARKLPIGPE